MKDNEKGLRSFKKGLIGLNDINTDDCFWLTSVSVLL